MALPLNNGSSTVIFSQFRRGVSVTHLNLPSSSKLIHRQTRTYGSGYKNSTRLLCVPANASLDSKTTGLELQQKQQQSDNLTTGWAEFAENASGEWDGFGAEFAQDGSPIELPDSVVPEAYREWEVKVFDWQTQCPTLARPTHFEFFYKDIKLLPTVGCEADAATRYSVEERNVDGAAAFAYGGNGCYVAIWPVEEKTTGTPSRLLELEHCLLDPRDRESRVRIIQILRFEEKGTLELQRIKVFCEQWYGPFRNGDQLGGCAIRDSAFAATQAVESSRISGVWQGLNATASFNLEEDPQKVKNVVIRELVNESIPRKSARATDGSRLTLLPKQLWSSLDHEAQGEICCQVGWLLDEGLVITSSCFFSSGAHLKEIAIACEAPELLQ